VFGFVTTGGELLNALIMFCAPAIVNRIGAKNALLTAGMIMSVRISDRLSPHRRWRW
jgi:OHS family lactose permease-like MFS transporter